MVEIPLAVSLTSWLTRWTSVGCFQLRRSNSDLVCVIWFEISPHQAPLIGVVSERLQISNLHPSLTHSLRALRSYKHFSFDIWTPELELQLCTKTKLCVDITKSVEPLLSHPLECILLLICALLFVYCVFWRLCAVLWTLRMQ